MPETRDEAATGDCWSVVARTLADAGVRMVLGIPSDEPGLLDAAREVPGLDVRVVGDQRIAACAAAGHAVTGRGPVVLALNSGPSFANSLAGLLEAASLSVPLVVITTRVPVEHIGQGAFQHLEQLRMVESLAGWTHRVETPGQVSWAVRRAVRLAVDGGPCLTVVEIAEEVATAEAAVPAALPPVRPLRSLPPRDELDAAADALRAARRPVVVAGGGTRWADVGRLAELAELLACPVFTTAAGRGAVDEDHERAFGLVGLYTTPPAHRLLEEADLLLVLGSRLEETARMGWQSWRTADVVQVDHAVRAFGEGCEVRHALLGDVGLVVDELADRLAARGAVRDPAWSAAQAEVAGAQRRHRSARFADSPVRAVLHAAQGVLGTDFNLVQENGLHDIWSYHYPVLSLGRDTSVVCPGEQTMMGFGLGAAAGAALARPDRPTLLLAGDSAFRMSVGALDVLRHHELGVIAVVFDNGGFGWPRRSRAGDRSRALTEWRAADRPDRVATAFGGWGADVTDPAALDGTLREAVERAGKGQFSVVRVRVPDDDVPVGIEAAGY
ncbi:thiamine pyrophosphate-binding protein [Streptomyces prasinopilosus]|uniref:thiamine pyrophosphate-binding protein n=1 Tax=Streptomyces prasinopilosus TaxID=67344 RepID=UPI0006EB3E22|nr:thiamine pyrophosphate-binding protein [Streptomyces prasinopilosus]